MRSFGLSPTAIGGILSHFGVSSTPCTTAGDFIAAVESTQGKKNQGYVLTFWNENYIDSAHTVFLSTNDHDNVIKVYNDNTSVSVPCDYYNIRELFTSTYYPSSDTVPAERFIYGYIIN